MLFSSWTFLRINYRRQVFKFAKNFKHSETSFQTLCKKSWPSKHLVFSYLLSAQLNYIWLTVRVDKLPQCFEFICFMTYMFRNYRTNVASCLLFPEFGRADVPYPIFRKISLLTLLGRNAVWASICKHTSREIFRLYLSKI